MFSLQALFTFCPLENMTSIDCRTVGTHEHYKSTGQNVWCSLPEGLICKNRDQPGTKLCYDYEVKFFCKCGIHSAQCHIKCSHNVYCLCLKYPPQIISFQ